MDDRILNMTKTLSLCNNNQALADELIAMLKTDLPRQKMILVDAFERDDERLLRDIVHQILGSCSYIALPQIEKSALEFQDAIYQKTPNLLPMKENLIKAIDAVITHHE